ncbi:MAG: type II toxin-antitoxin system HicB family antitoxin [Syntrophobacteraceae bacterium]
MEIQITFTAKLPIQIKKKAKWFVASCPVLDVSSQGETEEVAKKNIVEALYMFLRSCLERGTLDAVLKQCGFKSMVVQDEDIGPAESPAGQEYVDIPLHLLSRLEENRQCHRA